MTASEHILVDRSFDGKRVKVIVTGSNSTLDNGEAAILVTAIESLSEFLPGSSYVVGSIHQDVDARRYERMLPGRAVNVITGTKAQIGLHVRALLLLFRYIPEYVCADIGVDMSGDGFGDAGPYGVLGSLSHACQLLIGVFLRKPVVVYAQSIGPFKTRLTKLLAKFALNRVSLITVREDITKSYLEALGVRVPPLHLTADSAFLLEPALPERVNEILAAEGITDVEGPLFGVSVSQLIHVWASGFSGDKYESYLQVMARAVDHMIEKFGATVILVSQTTGEQARHDDRVAARSIRERTEHRDKVKVLAGELTPGELRGIVGRCEMFVGSKMHSTIASTSMFVPTVSIAYSHKVHGIVGYMLGQERAIVDIRTLGCEEFLSELLSKIDYVWLNRTRIMEELKERMGIIRERALLNARLVAALLRSRQRVGLPF